MTLEKRVRQGQHGEAFVHVMAVHAHREMRPISVRGRLVRRGDGAFLTRARAVRVLPA